MRFRGDSLPRNTLESSSPSTFLMRLDSSSSLSVCNRTTERGKGQKHPKQEIQLSKRHSSGSSWNPHASPQGKSDKLSGADGKMLCLQGSGTSLLQPMQKTQLSSPTPSLLPPLLPACTPLPLPCRVWQRGESPPRMDLSPLEPPASCACPAPECGASLCCCASFQKETEKGELTLEALFLLRAQTGAFTQGHRSSSKAMLKSTAW